MFDVDINLMFKEMPFLKEYSSCKNGSCYLQAFNTAHIAMINVKTVPKMYLLLNETVT